MSNEPTPRKPLNELHQDCDNRINHLEAELAQAEALIKETFRCVSPQGISPPIRYIELAEKIVAWLARRK